jgi:hypothetical protein
MPISRLHWIFFIQAFFFCFHQKGLTQILVEVRAGTKITLDSGASLRIMGDLMNHGTLGDSAEGRWGKLELNHIRRQVLSGSTPIQVDSLILDNIHGVLLETPLRVAKLLVFSSGKIIAPWADSQTAYVHFLPGAQWQQQQNTSYVQGWVHKSGDSPFLFPVGSAQSFRPIEISAPDQLTARFAAFYHHANPNAFGFPIQSLDTNCALNSMSNREFWTLDRRTASQPIQVTLHYDSVSLLPDPTLVMVSRWNGSAWESHGNGGWQANGQSGTITSGTGCGFVGVPATIGQFSPFGFGGAGPTPLPILFGGFFAECSPEGLHANWHTHAEWNNLYFILEKSSDASLWETLMTIPGAGTTQTPMNYHQLLPGFEGYFRITQIDVNGQSTSFGPWFVSCLSTLQWPRVWPNPTREIWHIQAEGLADLSLTLQDVSGAQMVLSLHQLSDHIAWIDAKPLAPGVYFLSGPGILPVKLVKMP